VERPPHGDERVLVTGPGGVEGGGEVVVGLPTDPRARDLGSVGGLVTSVVQRRLLPGVAEVLS
jgi:hypothetical protein